MNQKLINKAQELRAHGFTTGEIADELNVSLDTARWLILQKTEAEVKEEAPVDFYINWKSLGESSSRLRYASMALSDIAMDHGEIEVVVGIATSGVPFATMMADFIQDLGEIPTSLAIYHPNKHREGLGDGEGAISANFGTVKGKKVAIVDDVVTSGNTMKDENSYDYVVDNFENGEWGGLTVIPEIDIIRKVVNVKSNEDDFDNKS